MQWVYWSRDVAGKNDFPSEVLTARATNPRALGDREHLAIPRTIASAYFFSDASFVTSYLSSTAHIIIPPRIIPSSMPVPYPLGLAGANFFICSEVGTKSREFSGFRDTMRS